MATANTAEVRQLFARLPDLLRENVLRGAARAAARVVAQEAKALCDSSLVRDGIRIATTEKGTKAIAKVECRGKGAFIAPWLEYGTRPHLISVDARDRRGLSVRTINRRVAAGSLVLGGRFVGPVVEHPGARPHPFLRPALDGKQADAIAAAQAFINRRLTKAGLFTPDAGDDDQ